MLHAHQLLPGDAAYRRGLWSPAQLGGRRNPRLPADPSGRPLRCCAGSGSSKFEFRELNINKTLQDNGVVDEANAFEALDLPTDFHIPVLHAYWVDDLTVA